MNAFNKLSPQLATLEFTEAAHHAVLVGTRHRQDPLAQDVT